MSEFQRSLWAPWRVEFIRAPRSGACVFCGRAEPGTGPEEELMIARGRSCFVMLNRYPYNPGHLLIIPYRHCGDLTDLTPEERSELMELCVHAERVLRQLSQPAAFNAGFNLGAAAGAGVADHLHLHLVPRWHGDTNFMPVLADTRCVPEALSETAAQLRRAWDAT